MYTTCALCKKRLLTPFITEQRPEALTMNYWYVIINPRYLTTEHKEKITMKKFLISATLGLFAFLPVFVSAHLVKE